MPNSKAFKKKVRAFMQANPGWSYQASANHLRNLKAATWLPPKKQGGCLVCGATPVVPGVGMCGPCTFGDSGMAGGGL